MTRPTLAIVICRPSRPAVPLPVASKPAQVATAAPARVPARRLLPDKESASHRAEAVARRAHGMARKGYALFGALVACAEAAGIKPDSDEFDAAAALVGLPYCRALDLYVDPKTKRRAEELGFAQAHRALVF